MVKKLSTAVLFPARARQMRANEPNPNPNPNPKPRSLTPNTKRSLRARSIAFFTLRYSPCVRTVNIINVKLVMLVPRTVREMTTAKGNTKEWGHKQIKRNK